MWYTVFGIFHMPTKDHAQYIIPVMRNASFVLQKNTSNQLIQGSFRTKKKKSLKIFRICRSWCIQHILEPNAV